MKAMILAAGKGSRIRPMTYTVPKPMIRLIRKPIMESIIDHLAAHGIKEIVINTSHLSPVIENYFRDGNRFGVDIAYSFEGRIVNGEIQGEALGSAGGMKKIQEHSGFFDDTVIVLCGDALIDVDIKKILSFHRDRKSVATIVTTTVSSSEVSKYGVVQTDDLGRVLQFQEKPSAEEAISTTINTGIYLFEPEVFEHIPPNIDYDIGGQLFPALVQKGIAIHAISMDFQWLDIGSIPDYWTATEEVLRGHVKGYSMPGKEVKPGVWVGINQEIDLDTIEVSGPVYIGNSTSIGRGCRIVGPTVIGSNCHISPGAVVDECIIDDYTWISELAELKETMVFGGHCIDKAGRTLNIKETDIGWLLDDARKRDSGSESNHALIEMIESIKRDSGEYFTKRKVKHEY